MMSSPTTVATQLQQVGQTKLADYVLRAVEDIQRPLIANLDALNVIQTFQTIPQVRDRHKRIVNGDLDAGTWRAPEPPMHVNCSHWTADSCVSALTSKMADSETIVLHLTKSEMSEEVKQTFVKHGEDLIRQGKIACVLLAGGQGSRLGFDGPKGCYTLPLPSKRSLFEILCQRLARLQEITDAKSVVLYIMTSETNRQATEAFFREHDFFGLVKTDVMFFDQSVMPSFDLDWQVLLDSETQISRNANGNGGVFQSLEDTGMLRDMGRRGVTGMHVFGVDNVLTRVADPLFMGVCDLAQVPVGNKCCTKTDPHERVGVQAVLSHAKTGAIRRPGVVEYTEITREQAESRMEDGSLRFSAGNICNHYFRLDFVRQLVQRNLMNYHVAEKKIPHFDYELGEYVKPASVNGYKLELFIFDAFYSTEKLLALEVDRSEEFSPVKNGHGAKSDTPETAVQALTALHKRWLTEKGLLSPDDACMCEILNKGSYAGEFDASFAVTSNVAVIRKAAE